MFVQNKRNYFLLIEFSASSEAGTLCRYFWGVLLGLQPSIKHIRQKKRQTQVFSHSTYPFSCLSLLYTVQNFSQFKPSSLKFWSLKGQCQEIFYTIFSQKTLPFRKDICKFENCVTVYSQRVMTKRTVLDFGNPSILYFQNFAIV